PSIATAGLGAAGRARFRGCIYCHEVAQPSRGEDLPRITPPVIPDRWLLHGRYDHAKHHNMPLPGGKKMECTFCHAALQSTVTASVIMPSKLHCATCHSPQGGASQTCTTCHQYHRLQEKMPGAVASDR